MKVAITGHTYGIGAALKEKFDVEGQITMGFSRSNGYDNFLKKKIDSAS